MLSSSPTLHKPREMSLLAFSKPVISKLCHKHQLLLIEENTAIRSQCFAFKSHGVIGLVLFCWECEDNAFVLFVLAGKALEKAGGKEFLETVKELRKSQGPLEVAEGKKG